MKKQERSFGEILISAMSEVVEFEVKKKKRDKFKSKLKKVIKNIFFVDKLFK